VAFAYRPVDRDQVFLLPPSLKDWLPPEHLVWFVLAVVERLDTSAFHLPRRRRDPRGAAAFDPEMLLAVLIYAYARGVRSSRQIARLCEVDVAFMVACGQDGPSHQTLSRFVAETEDAVTMLFGQVLVLCASAGMVQLGVVAIDGTKIAANAAGTANRTRGWVQSQAARLVAEHRQTDADEDEQFGDRRGDELPEELTDPVKREAAIRRAMAELAARDDERAEQQASWSEATGRPVRKDRVTRAQARLERSYAQAQARYERTLASRQRSQAVPPEQFCRVREAKEQLRRAQEAQALRRAPAEENVNLTDPHSRVMKTAHGWLQGYNCQLAVTADQIVLAARVTQDTNDAQQFQPMMSDAVAAAATLPARAGSLPGIGVLLADAGYFSVANATAAGPKRLIAPDSRHNTDAASTGRKTDPVRQRMREELNTDEGRTLYRNRATTVEPVNGQLKDRRGLRQFRRRGLAAVTAELLLAATVHNLLKLANQ
jgi:transposase